MRYCVPHLLGVALLAYPISGFAQVQPSSSGQFSLGKYIQRAVSGTATEHELACLAGYFADRGLADSVVIALGWLHSVAGDGAFESGTWRYCRIDDFPEKPQSTEAEERNVLLTVGRALARSLPLSAQAWNELSYAHRKAGNLDSASLAIDRAIELGAIERYARAKLELLQELGDEDGLASFLELLWANRVDASYVWLSRAELATRRGQRTAAGLSYAEYIRRDAAEARQLDELASRWAPSTEFLVPAEAALGLSELIKVLREISERDSLGVRSHLMLSVVLSARGNALDALAPARKAVENSRQYATRGAVPLHQLGIVLSSLGRHAEALHAFDEATSVDALYLPSQYNRAVALHRLGRKADALSALARYLKRRGSEASAWAYAGEIASEVPRWKLAVSLLARALREKPDILDSRSGARAAWEEAVARAGVVPPADDALLDALVAQEGSSASGASGDAGSTGSGRLERRGTGFYVARGGYVLTNEHVVRGCGVIRVRREMTQSAEADVVALDSAADLAILRQRGGVSPQSTWPWRASDPVAGEEVVGFAFPLGGALGAAPVVGTGVVAAATGAMGAPDRFQLSVPVQAGSSGGPVLDRGGSVVGVIVSKLDALQVGSEIGDIPQNVNFAVKGRLAQSLMQRAGLGPPRLVRSSRRSTTDLAAEAARLVVLLSCDAD